MKEIYEKPEMEMIELETEDVLEVSGPEIPLTIEGNSLN